MASSNGMRVHENLWRDLDTAGMFSVPMAAELLNCDERTVRRACAAGQIPATRLGVRWQVPTWWLRLQVKPPEVAA